MSATIVSQALFLLFFLCINSPFVRLLDFSSNNHSSQIPSGLRGCSKLEVFQGGSNSVTLALSGLLPFDMYSAAGLRELSCPSNHLSGPIGNDIVNLTKLTNLELHYNEKTMLVYHLYLRSKVLEFETSKTVFPMPWSVLEIPKAVIVNHHVFYPLIMVAISLCAIQNCSFFFF